MMSPAYKANKLVGHYVEAVSRELVKRRFLKRGILFSEKHRVKWSPMASIVVRMVLNGSEAATKEFNAAYKAYRQYRLARGMGAQPYNQWVYSQQIKMVKELARQHVEEAFK